MLKKLLYTFLISTLLFHLHSCSTEPTILSETEKQWLLDNPDVSVAVFPYYAPYQFINENEKNRWDFGRVS